MRKLFSLFVVFLATTTLWAYDFQSGDLYYNITSSSAPYTVEVTYEKQYASTNYKGLTTANIPKLVTHEEVTYSVTSIVEGAFYDCSSLTSITIPNSITSIGNYAFYNCYFLTSITIPKSVTSIGYVAFGNCESLTSITIPKSVTSIESGTFSGCSSLTSVTIPNSVTSIGAQAFSGCSSLTSITIPNSVTSIESGAFRDCSNLTSITIPSSVTSIGANAFKNCSSLTSITIPNSVTSIGSYAFRDCTSLTSITIPNSVTSIGSDAFEGTGIYNNVSNWENDVLYIDNCLIDAKISISGAYAIKENTRLIAGAAFSHCSSLKSITIPNSVTSIGISAFLDCSSLTSITIPNSVTSIGDRAFLDCSALTSVTCEATIPPTVGTAFYGVSTSIPVYVPCGSVNAYKAADGWKEFNNIQEPQAEYFIQVSTSNSQMGSAKVNSNTLCDGANITATANFGYHFVQWSDGNINNPYTLMLTQDTTLTAEFAQSFSGQCGDNLYWSYDETTKTISITGSGNMYDYTADTQPWFLFKEQIVEVTTSNAATSIGTSAFEGCIRLGKVSIGSAMVNVGANAFTGCTRLYDVYCYATYPPFADESSFANYNVYVYIPCEYQRDYILDVVWGKFKFIECIESEETTTDDVVITPGTNDVTITWPTEGNADTYTIVIKKGDEVFCTLTFNADGQLLNIAFAPGRNGNHPAQYAEQAGNGYRFTVTGLEAGTHYAYNIDVRDAANKTIKSHAGEFTTESTTAVENTHSQSPKTNYQKILRNGQLLILRDGVEYTVMGQEL